MGLRAFHQIIDDVCKHLYLEMITLWLSYATLPTDISIANDTCILYVQSYSMLLSMFLPPLLAKL